MTTSAARTRRVNFSFAGRRGRLFAGPYPRTSAYPDAFNVKMAVEIDAPCDVAVDTQDFGVPDRAQAARALRLAAWNLYLGRDVFVGCGYGIGRTGLFLALLFKLDDHVRGLLDASHGRQSARGIVAAVRAAHDRRCVETGEQLAYVATFDVDGLARAFALLVQPTIVFDKRFWGR